MCRKPERSPLQPDIFGTPLENARFSTRSCSRYRVILDRQRSCRSTAVIDRRYSRNCRSTAVIDRRYSRNCLD
jgi:hypothetical protein